MVVYEKIIQWTGDNIEDIKNFMSPEEPQYMGEFSNKDDIVGVNTPEGLRVIKKGEWILCSIDGKYYTRKDM